MRTDEALSRRLGIPVLRAEETDSTNLRLKEAYRAGTLTPPCLLIAERQTMGRGRLGRSFLSPAGGLYMSLLLSMTQKPVTVLAAAAVCGAAEDATGRSLRIKWVNDLFLNGKKVCGILAEGLENAVVLGIGLNLKTPKEGFPGVPIAGALETDVPPEALAEGITRRLLALLAAPDDTEALNAYRSRMMLTGLDIHYEKNGQTKSALVLGVDDAGGLMVMGEDGRTETLRSGEVTLSSDQFLENRQPQ